MKELFNQLRLFLAEKLLATALKLAPYDHSEGTTLRSVVIKYFEGALFSDENTQSTVKRSAQPTSSFKEGENAFISELVPVRIIEVLHEHFYKVEKMNGETMLVDLTDLIKRYS